MRPTSARSPSSVADHPLLATLDPEDREQLSAAAVVEQLPVGARPIVQGEPATELLLVLSGRLETSVPSGEGRLALGTTGPGGHTGDAALFEGMRRSADVEVVEAARVARIPADRIAALPDARLRLIAAHAEEQAAWLGASNTARLEALEREVAEGRERAFLGRVVLVVVLLVTFYAYTIMLLNHASGVGLLLTSLGVAATAAGGGFMVLRRSHRDPSVFGLRVGGFRASLAPTLLWSLGGMGAITALKALGLALVPAWSGLPLLAFHLGATSLVSVATFLGLSLLYWLSCLVQELASRSFMQSSFELLMVGRWHRIWAIVLSNALFSVFHLHYSVPFALLSFTSGLCYGAFWLRHRNLWSITLLHWITATWAMDGLGLFGLPGFRL